MRFDTICARRRPRALRALGPGLEKRCDLHGRDGAWPIDRAAQAWPASARLSKLASSPTKLPRACDVSAPRALRLTGTWGCQPAMSIPG